MANDEYDVRPLSRPPLTTQSQRPMLTCPAIQFLFKGSLPPFVSQTSSKSSDDRILFPPQLDVHICAIEIDHIADHVSSCD